MHEWLKHHPGALWVVLLAYILVLWLFVAALVSYIGGWSALAKRFWAASSFVGARWKWRSGHMRWLAGYGNCLTLGASPQGLYLAVIPLFRFKHPPLLIPWSEISVSRRRLFFGNYVRFALGRDLRIPLWIRAQDGERLKYAAGDYWPVEQIE